MSEPLIQTTPGPVVKTNSTLIIKQPKEKKPKAVKENPLATLIQNLASSFESLAKDVAELKSQKGGTPVVPEQPIATIVTQADDFFLSAVPANLSAAATAVLGKKFKFECTADMNTPYFSFTVIVPPEYSPVKNGVDKRTRVIANALGANGVTEWCTTVRSNIVKYLGKNLPSNL